MVAPCSSTVCSSTRSASRAAETWLSAARVLFAVCWPLNSVCETVRPALRGALVPWTWERTSAVDVPPAVVRTSVYCAPALAVTDTFGR